MGAEQGNRGKVIPSNVETDVTSLSSDAIATADLVDAIRRAKRLEVIIAKLRKSRRVTKEVLDKEFVI